MIATDELFPQSIKALLNTRIGLYKLYDHFINFFISYRMFEHDLSFAEALSSNQALVKKKRGVADYCLLIKACLTLLRGKKPLAKKEAVFLSRYRPKSAKDLVTKDYLFDDIIHRVAHERTTALLVAQFSQDRYSDQICDNYSLIADCFTILVFFRSLILSALVYVRYLLLRNSIGHKYRQIFDFIFGLKRLFVFCTLNLCFERFLKKVEPRILIVNDDVLFRTKPIGVAINHVIVQSALLYEDQEYYRAALYSQMLPPERKADEFCVSGPFFKRLKERFSLDVNTVIVTGQPRFDQIPTIKSDARDVRTSMPDAPTVLWATEFDAFSDSEKRKNISAFADLLTRVRNINLVIKPHPAEVSGFAHYVELQKRFSSVEVRDAAEDIELLINACDIMVVKNSTSGIQGLLFDKPLVELNLSQHAEIVDYVARGVAIGAYDEAGFTRAISSLMRDQKLREEIKKNTEKYLFDILYKHDSNASYRVANVIARYRSVK